MCIDQSEAGIQVTWAVSANPRSVFYTPHSASWAFLSSPPVWIFPPRAPSRSSSPASFWPMRTRVRVRWPIRGQYSLCWPIRGQYSPVLLVAHELIIQAVIKVPDVTLAVCHLSILRSIIEVSSVTDVGARPGVALLLFQNPATRKYTWNIPLCQAQLTFKDLLSFQTVADSY